VRVLSRALDALRQLGGLPYAPVRRDQYIVSLAIEDGTGRLVSPGIHPEIRRLCRDAAMSINRYPVKDPLAFASSEDEDDEDDDEPVVIEEGFEDDDDDDEQEVEEEPEPA